MDNYIKQLEDANANLQEKLCVAEESLAKRNKKEKKEKLGRGFNAIIATIKVIDKSLGVMLASCVTFIIVALCILPGVFNMYRDETKHLQDVIDTNAIIMQSQEGKLKILYKQVEDLKQPKMVEAQQ
jgi:hypothetical protein